MISIKINLKVLISCIAIPLLVGVLAGFISKDSIETFTTLNKPVLSPPGWLFPIVWTILYILMGLASYIVVTSVASENSTNNAITFYAIQLGFNFFWTIWFFNFKLYFFSFAWLIILWVFILLTIIKFYKISKYAAYLMYPYLLWVTFAGFLNFSITLLN